MATNNELNVGLSGSTGTGTFVGSGSPTITTPKIAQINDTNGNAIIGTTVAASAVNYLNIGNSAAAAPVFIQALGTDTDIGMQYVAKGAGQHAFYTTATSNQFIMLTGAAYQHGTTWNIPSSSASRIITVPDATGTMLMTGQAINTVPSITFSSTSGIIGTTTNNNAAALSVGEVISSNVAVSTTSLASGTIADTTSISLTAGDWDVYGTVGFFGNAATTPTFLKGWCSTTSATDPGSPNISTVFPTGVPFATAPLNFSTPFLRVSIASTTTVYLSVQALFGTSTCTSGGQIVARRAR